MRTHLPSSFSAPILHTLDFCLERSLVFFSRIIGEKQLVISEKLRYLLLLIFFELAFLLVLFFFAGNMANVCERCKCSMSSHYNHASCPQCRMAAGDCSLDSENPCTTCKVWTRRQWGKLRRSLVDARARSCQRGRQHWSAAFPRLEAWIQSKPASTSASEISSQAGEGDFE